MQKSLLNRIGTACLHMALSTSTLSAVGAAQSYYRTRRGSYGAGRNQYIVDPNIKPISTTSFKQRTAAVTQKAARIAVESGFNFTKGQSVRELLIVDGSVKDKSLIFRQAQPGVEVVEIKAGEGLNSLLKILGNYSQLDAVHIISHAKSGVLYIGGETVNQKTIENNVAAFASVNNAIREGGDLMLYGCDLAKGEAGNDFLEIIKNNTHADVAASIDKTGNAEYGGNWELEIQKGDIEAKPLPESIAMNDLTGTLQFSGTIDFSQVKYAGDAYGGPSVNAEFYESAAKNHILIVDGLNGGTDNYYGEDVAATYVDETSVTLKFSNGEAFDPQSILVNNWHSSAHTFNFASDKGDSKNISFANGEEKTVDLSDFADDISSLTISSDKVYVTLDDFEVGNVGGSSNSAPTASNVAFTGTLEVGKILTGDYDYSDADSDTESGSTFKWYRSDDASGTNKAVINGATSKTYSLVSADEGKYISFEVTPKDGTTAGNAKESSRQGPVIQSVLLSSSPTISFSNTTGFTNNIAEDGQGGSTVISDLDLQILPINSAGTKLIASAIEYHDDTDWGEGYPPIITYGSATHYGWQIKSDDGSNFSLLALDFHDWGNYDGATFVIEAFENGSSKGTATFTGNTTGGYIQLDNAEEITPAFQNVDEVRLYEQGGADSFIGLNNVQVSTMISNTTPTASNIPTDITVTEDVASNVNLSAVSFADADGDALTATLAASAGSLTASSGGGVTIGGSGTGTLTLAGTAANINTFLDTQSNIKYTGTSNTSGNNAANLTINANDGTVNPQLGTVNIDITAVNDAPTVTSLPSDITVIEDVASNVDISSATFADVDGDALTATLSASVGTLSAISGGGVTISGSGTAALSLVGTAANINTYLNTPSNIQYTGASNANGNDAATLTINGNDGTVNPQLGTVNLDITAVNDAPVASNVVLTGTLEVGEPLTGSYDYSDVESNPESGSTFKWYRSDDASGTNKTAISGATSSIYTLMSADEGKYISFEVTPRDGTTAGAAEESTEKGPVTDPVPDINVKGNSVTIANGDNTPSAGDHTDFGDIAAASGTISRTFTIENTGDLGLTMADSDGSGFVTVSGTNAGDFEVTDQPDSAIASAGSSTFVVRFDPDAIGEKTATVNINSDDPDENPYTFTIKGTALNTTPAITSAATADVNETATAVQTVTATDADGHTPAFSINGGADAALFSIDAGTGALTFNAAPDFENPKDADTDNIYVVEVKVSDGKGSTDAETVTITVKNLNDERPVFTSANTADVDENTTAVLTVAATDADAASAISYSITDGADQSLFSINNTSGVLTFKSAPDAENPGDSDTDNNYVVQVAASDGTFSESKNITITVKDVNDNAPTFKSEPYSVGIDEDAPVGEVVVTIGATDADNGANAEIEYSITGGNGASKFAIDSNTGEITAAQSLDFETTSSYALEITASDKGISVLSDVTTVNITIQDANDNAPVAVDDGYETSEDTELHIAAAGVLANDTDEDFHTDFSAIMVNQPAHGTLILDADGSFTYTPDVDYFGPDNFTYQVDDRKATSNVATVSLIVNPLNDAPTISNLEDISIAINSATRAIGFTIDDVDSDVSTLVVFATASNSDLLPASGIVLSEGNLVLTPATDKMGSTQVTIAVSDGELETKGTFTLTVYPVNVAPTDIALSNNTFLESIKIGEEIGTFSTADENSDDHHSYLLVSGDGDLHNDLFVIEGDKLISNGEYDYELANELSIRVRTTDRWEETFEKIFMLRLIADPALELLIPTAITPNDDGENDTWEIDNIFLHPGAVVKVFNRDGQAIFSSVGYEKEWDGTYNGRALPFGTYYFIIDLNDRSSRTYKGTIMIIR